MLKQSMLALAGVPNGRLEDPFERQTSKVDSLDLSMITRKLGKKLGWSHDEAENAEKWYRRFLHLVEKYPTVRLVPNRVIDEMWHAHILDTRKYAEDCKTTFGYFVHHHPSYDDGKDMEGVTFERTNELFLAEFGEMARVDDSPCSGCERCDKGGGECRHG